MPYDQVVSIASKAHIEDRVESLKRRSDDIKSRIAHILKQLWNPERTLVGVAPTLDFATLRQGFPQFREVIDYVDNSVFTSSLTESSFRIPPILLTGDPGLGKTYFASQLAELLGLPFFEISMASMSSGFVLSGGNLQWSEGSPGEIAKILARSPVANPIVLVDEIDKASGSYHYNPINCLYSLLEPHTACRFKDECLDIELDARYIIWICTANYPDHIPLPIRSRIRSFDITQPPADAMIPVVEHMYARFREKHPCGQLLESQLELPVLMRLAEQSPRSIRLNLEEASMKAVRQGRRMIKAGDLMPEAKEVRRVGFI